MICLSVILYSTFVEENISECLKHSQWAECKGMKERNGKINTETEANMECIGNTDQEPPEQSEESESFLEEERSDPCAKS